MIRRLINWFRGEPETRQPEVRHERRRSSAHATMYVDKRKYPESKPDALDPERPLDGHVESQGPGKNVFVRKKYIREDTGTYETLKIVDDSLLDSPDEDGIDPYNSGEFDRSRNWDRRFRN